MDPAVVLLRLAIALAAGLLLGIQRESNYDKTTRRLVAGVQTSPLLALTGAVGALLTILSGTAWLVAVPILIVGTLAAVSFWMAEREGRLHATTELSAVLTSLIGALCGFGELIAASALTIVLFAIHGRRVELRGLADRMTAEDTTAILKFGLVSAIILPVVPDTPLGDPPFDVLSAHQIWSMVVLISALSFVGYLAMSFVGASKGIALTGFLGGLVSSTAVTATFAGRSKGNDALAPAFAMAIIVAWTVMFFRVIVEVGSVNRPLLEEVWVPMAAAAAGGLVYAWILHKRSPDEEVDSSVELQNPFELSPALKFGVIYAIILVVSRAAQIEFGESGIYASALLAGLTDVDAITLSMAELSQPGGDVSTDVASNAIAIAAMSNTCVKCGIAGVTGSLALRRSVLPGFLIIVAAGLGAAFLL